MHVSAYQRKYQKLSTKEIFKNQFDHFTYLISLSRKKTHFKIKKINIKVPNVFDINFFKMFQNADLDQTLDEIISFLPMLTDEDSFWLQNLFEPFESDPNDLPIQSTEFHPMQTKAPVQDQVSLNAFFLFILNKLNNYFF